MSVAPLPPEGASQRTSGEDVRQHLDLIQGVVIRMATASSTAKGWLLPVATATYGYALIKNAPAVALLGIGGTLLFSYLDAQYLRQERAYRALFRAVVAGRVRLYEMSARAYYGKPNGDEADEREENCRWPKVILSWSLAGFYTPIILVGAVVAARASHHP